MEGLGLHQFTLIKVEDGQIVEGVRYLWMVVSQLLLSNAQNMGIFT
ncbi:hypothetical protein KSB_90550 [Ktedonobacter robiniae]|uniref:Uncharacterized protein n=1 Tax=Ktedonobacter robiniae TaxID=2778365 RepID=A0ABQ3V866_9CHLR|nr:hypothetical protein [Ktedonobacter robiniae]GHO60580.1 hypothetical protein KSB_90550 [Ktedonobacter robiniae]